MMYCYITKCYSNVPASLFVYRFKFNYCWDDSVWNMTENLRRHSLYFLGESGVQKLRNFRESEGYSIMTASTIDWTPKYTVSRRQNGRNFTNFLKRFYPQHMWDPLWTKSRSISRNFEEISTQKRTIFCRQSSGPVVDEVKIDFT